ncbi:glycosyltransferase family 1 protein [Lactarius pseudohatsudake]|nr:glycosyltransferase family 1 protein [Lactarius pseudohatsudake]
MRVLVTVGSTRFDALVETALSQPKGYSDVVVQCGNSRVDELGSTDVEGSVHKYGVDVKLWRFKPSLDEEYDAADLVIGHAGSGTILDVLRRSKPLIIEDMAHAMGALGYAKISTVNGLSQSIIDLDTSKLVPFPPFDGSKFRRLMDQEMGFEL